MSKSLGELLNSADPLSEEAIIAALDAREENALVDYKVSFENEDREWLEVTKDVMSFANTEGGYLAFGVKNGTYERVGLDEGAMLLLSDPNNLMQKFNRHVEPHFTGLRAKVFEQDRKRFVVVLVPASLGHTHIVSKDGAYTHPSGTPKVVLRRGTFYVRRSGANHLADARDLDAVIERRIRRFRSKLLENITRVVESPVETEVLVVKQKGGEEGLSKKFVIENSSNAIAVKGMTFSVAPETPEQEVAAWTAINEGNSAEVPSAGTVWRWYGLREQLQLTLQQRLRVAMFSLLKGAPAFYWLRGSSAPEIKEALVEALGHPSDADCQANTLAVSAFFGKRFHKSQVTKLGERARRLGKVSEFPEAGPRAYFEAALAAKHRGGKLDRYKLKTELDEIVQLALREHDAVPARSDRWHAMRLDCCVYAQDEYPDKASA